MNIDSQGDSILFPGRIRLLLHFFQMVVTILRFNVNKQARPPRLATTRSTATTATQQRRLPRSVVVAVRGRGDPRDLGGAGKQT